MLVCHNLRIQLGIQEAEAKFQLRSFVESTKVYLVKLISIYDSSL